MSGNLPAGDSDPVRKISTMTANALLRDSAPPPAEAQHANARPRTRPASRPLGEQFQRFLRTPKGGLFLVFVPLLVVASATAGLGDTLPHVAAAVLAAVATDLVMSRLERDSWQWPSSALLTGLFVAFILAPIEPRLVTVAVSMFAIASKHILVLKKGHIFNPAALALVLSVPAFGTGQSWWGAFADVSPLWLIPLVVGGVFVVDRINKYPSVLAFLATYFGLFSFGALLNPTRVAEMFRAPFTNSALFFALFMLTDPPTSPARPNEQVWFGALVAVASAVAQLGGVGQTYLLVGLLAGNAAYAVWRWQPQSRVASQPTAAGPVRASRPAANNAQQLAAVLEAMDASGTRLPASWEPRASGSRYAGSLVRSQETYQARQAQSRVPAPPTAEAPAEHSSGAQQT
jgi:Na+-translocating ferredoxin:NAD+ oxidoreductase RnfD subunit